MNQHRKLRVELDFTKKRKFALLLLQRRSLQQGSCFRDDCNSLALLVRGSAHQKHMLLFPHPLRLVCHCRIETGPGNPPLWQAERPGEELSASWPEPLQSRAGTLPTLLPERGPAWWIQEGTVGTGEKLLWSSPEHHMQFVHPSGWPRVRSSGAFSVVATVILMCVTLSVK